eukprot:CAMPEP_0172935372 /NCGR_PEP_ID=MMETSP1075-20121228/221481_1 /TAXON_ID=2916 /ORGANISM="Ceratium fusus, Strain PA161109" /LENGTH=119 /DNA_ID=CAMNT_0013796731 /DNA_START=172 /DNA_END=531 /DNA_ORIENTATION=+
MDDLELNLPSLVQNNPWLKQKFMQRMENLRQKALAELSQEMYEPAVVESHDGDVPPKSFFEPMKVAVDLRDCQDQRLSVGTDSEGDDVAATMVMIPKVEDIGMPMKLLCHGPAITKFGS